jgi:hypothetical protein
MLGEHPVIEREADDEGDQSDDERVDLGPNLGARMSGAVRQRDVGRAVDHRDADPGDEQDHRQEQPVDVEIQPSFEHG